MRTSALDLAPVSRRPGPIGIFCLGLTLLALAYGARNLWTGLHEWRLVRAELASKMQVRELQRQRRLAPASVPARDEGPTVAAVHALVLPWDGVLTVVERAAASQREAVSVTSLREQLAEDGGMDVAISARAKSPDAVLSYVEAVGGQPGVGGVKLLGQQHEDGASGNFQLAFKWHQPSSVARQLGNGP